MHRQSRLVLGLLLGCAAIAPFASRASGETIPQMLPEETLLYVQWPGFETLSETASETELAKMMNEPEWKRFRQQCSEQLWPDIEDLMVEEMGRESVLYPPIKEWIESMWMHPTSVGLVGVAMGPMGPQVDVAIVIRAGGKGKAMLNTLDKLLAPVLEDMPEDAIGEVKLGEATFKQIMIPDVRIPVRYGQLKDDVILTIGAKVHALMAGKTPDATSLGDSADFKKAMEITGGSPKTVVMYLNIESIIQTLERFQPMLAGMEVPILGKVNGLRETLEKAELNGIRSLSSTMRPHKGGFLTTILLHQPIEGDAARGGNWVEPVDVRAIPKKVTWAGVSRGDLVTGYESLLGLVRGIDPEVDEMAGMFIKQVESVLEMPIPELLGAFGDTWVTYDAPDHGGLWFTGLTMMAKADDSAKIDAALRRAVAALSAALGSEVVVRNEEYRQRKIATVNVPGVPMPVAPSWTEAEGYWILTLHPQMARAAIDHLMDGHPSLADNPDFKRARALMPENIDALSYGDVRGGVEMMYRFILPLSQMGISMVQAEGVPLDASLMPSLPSITRHLFGAIGASTMTKDGYVWLSHTPVPGLAPSSGMSANVSTTSMMVSILLPSLARARELSKRTVSAANLKVIGTCLYIYGTEHGDDLPDSLQVLVEDGCIAPQTLIAPQDDGVEDSYVYVKGQNLGMHQMNVLMYERPDMNDWEGVNVLFLDSHVEFVSMERFEKYLEETEQRLAEAKAEER